MQRYAISSKITSWIRRLVMLALLGIAGSWMAIYCTVLALPFLLVDNQGNRSGWDHMSKEQIERFTIISLPASVANVRSALVLGLDGNLDLYFEMDEADVGVFLQGSRFPQPLQPGKSFGRFNEPVFPAAIIQPWWKPSTAAALGWASDTQVRAPDEKAVSRTLLLSQLRPGTVSVYLQANR